jgi:hypothetical protein
MINVLDTRGLDALSLVYHSLAVAGLAYVVGHATISQDVRDGLASAVVRVGARLVKPFTWPLKLVECWGCLGFWIGAGVAWLQHDATPLDPFFWSLGCFTSATTLLFGRVLEGPYNDGGLT